MPLLTVFHRQQVQQADCLAACATMALEYLQIVTDYQYLLQLMGVMPIGAPFSHLRQLESLGVSVRFGRGNLADLRALLETGLPAIVPVSTSELSYWTENTEHAVLVVGIDEEIVWLNDPDLSYGPVGVAWDEFVLAWLEHDYRYAVISLSEFS